jgi:integrase
VDAGEIRLDKAGSPVSHVIFGEPAPFHEQTTKGLISTYAYHLGVQGRAKATIINRVKRFTQLGKLCNIADPEQVKAVLANLPWENSTKKSTVAMFTDFFKFIGKQWEEPKYKPIDKLPFIPTEQEIDRLIASCGKTTACLLQLLKETGMRIGEAAMLKWTDYDRARKTLNVTPEKGSNPRILPVSDTLQAMLNNLHHKEGRETIFMKTSHNIRSTFSKQRKTAAEKLQDPRILQIHLHTFRHWKATTQYHDVKDIMEVKKTLGHKDIKSTMIYINLESALWLAGSDKWLSKVSNTIEEETELINNGWQLVRAITENKTIYRKLK